MEPVLPPTHPVALATSLPLLCPHKPGNFRLRPAGEDPCHAALLPAWLPLGLFLVWFWLGFFVCFGWFCFVFLIVWVFFMVLVFCQGSRSRWEGEHGKSTLLVPSCQHPQSGSTAHACHTRCGCPPLPALGGVTAPLKHGMTFLGFSSASNSSLLKVLRHLKYSKCPNVPASNRNMKYVF